MFKFDLLPKLEEETEEPTLTTLAFLLEHLRKQPGHHADLFEASRARGGDVGTLIKIISDPLSPFRIVRKVRLLCLYCSL